MRYWVTLRLMTAEMPAVCIHGKWPHTCTYSRGRAVRESDTTLKSPTDLIMSCTLNRKSPRFYTFTPVYCDQQQVGSNRLRNLSNRVCQEGVFSSRGSVWSKYPALISSRRSFARGLLNINYISIFSLTTRWLLICDLQTATGNYWSGPCCHSDDN